MKLTVLVDNATLTDRYFSAEPGLSFCIEDGRTRILFDLGYSGLFLENAQKMGIDLSDTDYVVLSHGHLDHTWGLDTLVRLCSEAKNEGLSHTEPVFVGHPEVFASRRVEGAGQIGCMIGPEMLKEYGEVRLSRAPLRLSENIIFLGSIGRIFPFEGNQPVGTLMTPSGSVPDLVPDDSALVCTTPRGIVIITGCSHSGICSIVEQAKRVSGDDRVLDIIGGFHLLDAPDEQIRGTCEYLGRLAPVEVHACHCTDLAAKIALSGVVNLREVGVGLTLEYP